MLETIREFAAEQLSKEEGGALVRRLLAYLLELFEDANLRPRRAGQPRMELAQGERANVDVALAWATDTGEAPDGLRLLELLEMYWSTNDPIGGRGRLDQLLAVGGDDLEPQVLAKALRFRGATFDMTSRNDLGERGENARAIELLKSVGDEAEAAHLSLRIANAAIRAGDVERAKADRRRIARCRPAVSPCHPRAGRVRRGGHRPGCPPCARGCRRRGSRRFRWRGVTLLGTSETLLALGQLETAQTFFAEGLDVLRSVRDLVNLPIALAAGAALAAQLGDAARAGTLWGALGAQAEREPRQTTIENQTEYEPYLEPVLGAAFDEARRRGRTLSLEEAVAYALGEQT